MSHFFLLYVICVATAHPFAKSRTEKASERNSEINTSTGALVEDESGKKLKKLVNRSVFNIIGLYL